MSIKMASRHNASANKLGSLVLKRYSDYCIGEDMDSGPRKPQGASWGKSVRAHFTERRKGCCRSKTQICKVSSQGLDLLAIRAHEFMKTLSRAPSPAGGSLSALAPAVKGLWSLSARDAGNTSQVCPAPHHPWHERPFRGTHPNIHLHHFVQRNPDNLHPKIIGCFVKRSMGTLGGHTKREEGDEIQIKTGFKREPS